LVVNGWLTWKWKRALSWIMALLYFTNAEAAALATGAPDCGALSEAARVGTSG